jgi:hypothetical protein
MSDVVPSHDDRHHSAALSFYRVSMSLESVLEWLFSVPARQGGGAWDKQM